MTIAIQEASQEEGIKALLNQIKSERARPKPSQADIILQALELLSREKR